MPHALYPQRHSRSRDHTHRVAIATAPRYRFIASVPEGQFDDERRHAMVKEVTEAATRPP